MVVSDKRASEDKVRTTLAKAGARLNRHAARVDRAHLQGPRRRGAASLRADARTVRCSCCCSPSIVSCIPHSAEKMGYHAELVPVGNHSVAVIGASEAAVEQGIELARQSIEWSLN